MSTFRRPGIHEVSDEKVLLVTKDKTSGAERVDWWPSVKEAEESNMQVLEVRETRKIQKRKSDWKGLKSMLALALGRSGPQESYLRERSLDQREFFESVEDKEKRPVDGMIR